MLRECRLDGLLRLHDHAGNGGCGTENIAQPLPDGELISRRHIDACEVHFGGFFGRVEAAYLNVPGEDLDGGRRNQSADGDLRCSWTDRAADPRRWWRSFGYFPRGTIGRLSLTTVNRRFLPEGQRLVTDQWWIDASIQLGIGDLPCQRTRVTLEKECDANLRAREVQRPHALSYLAGEFRRE